MTPCLRPDVRVKARLIGLICVAMLVSPAQSQFLRGYGVKLGASSAKQMWDYTMDFNLPVEGRWGFVAGVFVEGFNIPYFSILAELQYAQKGFSLTSPIATEAEPDASGQFITTRPRLDYLSIPILAKIRFETGNFTPYLIAGPRLDFLIGRQPEGVQAVFDKLNSTDFGVSLGGGIEVPIGFASGILAEFRYSPSFTEAYNSNVLTVKNQSIEILLGVRL